MKYLILGLFVISSLTTLGQTKQIVKPRNAPANPYPFSPAVISNGLMFVSGQVGTDPATTKLVSGGVEAETEQTIRNIEAILKDGGASLDNVVSVTVYLSNMDDFPKMNAVYRQFFKEGTYPARTTVGVAKLVFGAAVEMTMTASMPGRKK